MKKKNIGVGDVLVNRYGQTFHIKGIVKRGAVGTLGNDIHQVLREWPELRKDWNHRCSRCGNAHAPKDCTLIS